jgi:peptide/nickel transport system permease protein
MFARIVVAAQTTVGIALVATTLSMTCGGLIGVWVATQGGWASAIVMRLVDVIMSFPSLLMALVVLYVLGPSPANIVLVLAITRLPIFIRTARSQALEIKERPFVKSARVTGAGTLHIARKHVVPLVLPTVLTVASLEFAFIILAESALSFLGVGVQPPGMTWGLMVSQGRAYLASAWWLSFWPGLAIMLTALSANILANQFRLESDPVLASRLTQGARADA